MLVSHEHRFIYIKTVKTAGTSVEAALEPFCAHGIVGARGDGARAAQWYHHMPARRIRAGLPRAVWRGYLKVCNIRNPWDKAVSWFHFRNPAFREAPPAEAAAAFRAFVAGFAPGAERLGQDFAKYTIGGRAVVDVYLRHGALADDFAGFCGRVGIAPVPALPRLKAGHRSGADWADYYDAESRARVARTFAPEIAAFGWRFDDPLPEYLPETGSNMGVQTL